jgi:hypothetical protein
VWSFRLQLVRIGQSGEKVANPASSGPSCRGGRRYGDDLGRPTVWQGLGMPGREGHEGLSAFLRRSAVGPVLDLRPMTGTPDATSLERGRGPLYRRVCGAFAGERGPRGGSRPLNVGRDGPGSWTPGSASSTCVRDRLGPPSVTRMRDDENAMPGCAGGCGARGVGSLPEASMQLAPAQVNNDCLAAADSLVAIGHAT